MRNKTKEKSSEEAEVSSESKDRIDLSKRFQCTGCSHISTSSKVLAEHFRRKHSGQEKRFKCRILVCEKKFYDRWKRKIHEISHKPLEERKKYICEDCFSITHSEFSLKKHKTTNCSEMLTSAKYDCNLCKSKFRAKSALRRHIKGVHEGVRNKICQICHQGFSDIAKVKKHTKSVHTLVTDYQCPYCNETYYSSSGKLKVHLANVHAARRQRDKLKEIE